MQGKVIIIQNSTLAGMKITNETRATNAIFEIPLKIDFYTSSESMNLLEESIKEYINSHPSDFVKDFVFIFISELHPGYYYEVSNRLCRSEYGLSVLRVGGIGE